MIWNEEEELLFSRWQAQGWLQLAPQQCEQVLITLLRQYLFLSPTKVIRPGSEMRWLSRFGLNDPGPIRSADTGSYGIERFFCVREEPFQRQTVTLEEHENCPEGWYEQLFTVLVVNGGREPYRLSFQ